MRINSHHIYVTVTVDTSDIFIRELHPFSNYVPHLICVGCIHYNVTSLCNINFDHLVDIKELIIHMQIQLKHNCRVSGGIDDIYIKDGIYYFIYGHFDEERFVEELKEQCKHFMKVKNQKRLKSINSMEGLLAILSKTKYFRS